MAAGDIVVLRENASSRKGNYYDGTDDAMNHNAQAVARVAANDVSGCFTAWIYLNDIAGTYGIIGLGDNSGAAEHFHISCVAGKIQAYHRPAAALDFDVIETAVTLTARKWHHIAVNHTGIRPDIYIDGVVSAMTDTDDTDLTSWYDELPDVDEMVIGAKTINNVESTFFNGAIGQVKYWSIPLYAQEIMKDYLGEAQGTRAATLAAALQFNVTMEDDGVTDSGLGADDGTAIAETHYGGEISDWSYKLEKFTDVTGHAAEFMNTFIDGSDYVTIIKKGD